MSTIIRFILAVTFTTSKHLMVKQDGTKVLVYRFNLYNPVGYIVLFVIALLTGVVELIRTTLSVMVEVISISIKKS